LWLIQLLRQFFKDLFRALVFIEHLIDRIDDGRFGFFIQFLHQQLNPEQIGFAHKSETTHIHKFFLSNNPK